MNNNNLICTKIEDEFRVFFTIKKIRELLNYDQIICNRKNSEFTKDELSNFKRVLQHNYSQLPRFGIHLNYDITNNKYELNDDFYLWFDFWTDHLNSMNNNDIALFTESYNKKESLDKFYPVTSWNQKKNHTINLIKE